jgi:transcriptional regulator GlxA family with amidase domain
MKILMYCLVCLAGSALAPSRRERRALEACGSAVRGGVAALYAGRPEPATRLVAGVNDRIVGAALKEMHATPARPWTLDDLAHRIGSSRSVLAERFLELVGTTPMQYLTRWRMLLAANLLSRSQAPLSSIAEQVGYRTDTAFSRAFRREFGAPPAKWRRGRVTERGVSS